MSKTYWWRVGVLLVGALVFGWGHLAVNGTFKYNTYVDPLMFLSLALLIVSLFLFFISDVVFLRWLRFAFVWFILTFILVALAPVYTGGFMGFGPTKESVSIWMGILFVIVSLVKVILDSRKQKSTPQNN